MAQLYSAGVPLPFECAYAAKVNNYQKVEKALHIAFGPDRINPRRGFFEIDSVKPTTRQNAQHLMGFPLYSFRVKRCMYD